MDTPAVGLAIDGRRHPAVKRLGLCLMFSMLAHGALMQFAPSGAVWGCCGKEKLSLQPASAASVLLVRLDRVASRAADLAKKQEALEATHPEAKEGIETATGGGFLPYYYSPTELSKKPQAATDIQFPPLLALGETASGKVVLELLINEAGGLDSVRVESASLPEPVQKIAAETFRQAIFNPGMKDGLPVKSRLWVEVTIEDVAPDNPNQQGTLAAAD